jgi:hypothetical protein
MEVFKVAIFDNSNGGLTFLDEEFSTYQEAINSIDMTRKGYYQIHKFIVL